MITWKNRQNHMDAGAKWMVFTGALLAVGLISVPILHCINAIRRENTEVPLASAPPERIYGAIISDDGSTSAHFVGLNQLSVIRHGVEKHFLETGASRPILLNRDGSRFAVYSHQRAAILLFDTDAGEQVGRIPGDAQTTLHFSPGGMWLLIYSHGTPRLDLYDAQTGTLAHVFDVYGDVREAAFMETRFFSDAKACITARTMEGARMQWQASTTTIWKQVTPK